MKSERVGWIGLGIMGRPMAENLLRAGFEVTAYNRTPARLEEFVLSGGQAAASPRDVARASDVIVTMVSDTPDVEEVLFGAVGVSAAARAAQVLIDMSTISPRATRDFAARLRAQGIELLDAPVSGGESGAIAGTLSIMVGGERSAFDRCAGIFAALGKRVTHMGPSGSGQATKLVNQVAVLGNLLAACEALRLAAAAGLDGGRVVEAVGAGAGASWQLANLGPKILARDFAPGFPVRLARKDLRLVLEAAEELRVPLPLVRLVKKLFDALGAAGGDDEGTQALARIAEPPAENTQ
jgi:3-hydroxyisobutyrate dehydrogenase-like beta-hydroxyacid dehydrogenase